MGRLWPEGVECGPKLKYPATMIALVAALLLAGNCSGHPISLEQAKQLVLAAPNIRAAVTERGAKPIFEWIGTGRNGWNLDVNSATRCLHADACSTLLGHFSVGRDGQVEDFDRGEDGVLISSARMRRLTRDFQKADCKRTGAKH
jgi:hypothetical protein